MNRFRAGMAGAIAVWLLSLVVVSPALAAIDGETATGTVVDLNKASAEQLQAIRGIGPVLAQRIVEFRDDNGPFERVEDIMKVKGIGEKSFQKIRPFLKVEKKK